MHMMISVNQSSMTEIQKEKILYLIRESVVGIVREDEVQVLVDSVILKYYSDIYELQELATLIISHKCGHHLFETDS